MAAFFVCVTKNKEFSEFATDCIKFILLMLRIYFEEIYGAIFFGLEGQSLKNFVSDRAYKKLNQNVLPNLIIAKVNKKRRKCGYGSIKQTAFEVNPIAIRNYAGNMYLNDNSC